MWIGVRDIWWNRGSGGHGRIWQTVPEVSGRRRQMSLVTLRAFFRRGGGVGAGGVAGVDLVACFASYVGDCGAGLCAISVMHVGKHEVV